jgi:hypothetical protein
LHQTQHTYVQIVRTQEAFDQKNAVMTSVYVQRITVKVDKHSNRIAQLMKCTITSNSIAKLRSGEIIRL